MTQNQKRDGKFFTTSERTTCDDRRLLDFKFNENCIWNRDLIREAYYETFNHSWPTWGEQFDSHNYALEIPREATLEQIATLINMLEEIILFMNSPPKNTTGHQTTVLEPLGSLWKELKTLWLRL